MAASLSIGTRLPLNHGTPIPVLGLGVWQAGAGDATRAAVRAALDAGYRLIDTARMYGNEVEVGEAIRASGVPREEIFVTTKLSTRDQGYEPALAAAAASLKRLDLGYIDLYLIHWPSAEPPSRRLDTWRALEKLQQEGTCRSVGVSNYTVRHLEELHSDFELLPAVNQVEFHPFLYQRELLEYCHRRKIQLEAYAPLVHGRRLDDPRLLEIAARHHRSVAQVLLRWGLEHGVVEIPKSSRPERIVENSKVFDFSLSAAEMAALNALNDGFRTTFDPEEIV
jgi:diketogulonate reductase-like aldo/keto reductase